MYNQHAPPFRRLTGICRCTPKTRASYGMSAVSKNKKSEVRVMFVPRILTEQKQAKELCCLCHYGHYMCMSVVLQRVIIIFQREHHFNKFHTKSYNHEFCSSHNQHHKLNIKGPPCNLNQLALIFQYDGTN